MTGGLIAFILAAIVIVVACCKSKKKRRHKKSKTTITSTYPGFLTSVYRQMPYPKVNSWFAKVMFSQVSVCPGGGGGLGLCPGGSLSGGFLSGRPSWTERHTPDREKPSGQRPPLDREPPCTVMGGRYASYWNAFLFPMHTCILFLFQAIQIYIRIFYYFKVLNFSVACLFAVLLHGILAEVDILDYKVAKTKNSNPTFITFCISDKTRSQHPSQCPHQLTKQIQLPILTLILQRPISGRGGNYNLRFKQTVPQPSILEKMELYCSVYEAPSTTKPTNVRQQLGN